MGKKRSGTRPKAPAADSNGQLSVSAPTDKQLDELGLSGRLALAVALPAEVRIVLPAGKLTPEQLAALRRSGSTAELLTGEPDEIRLLRRRVELLVRNTPGCDWETFTTNSADLNPFGVEGKKGRPGRGDLSTAAIERLITYTADVFLGRMMEAAKAEARRDRSWLVEPRHVDGAADAVLRSTPELDEEGDVTAPTRAK